MQVVPFTHAAGLLEWIEETTPLLDVLTGGAGKNYALSLHGRHARPKDYSHVQCWKALADERSAPNVTTLFARQQATFAKVSAPAELVGVFGIVRGRPFCTASGAQPKLLAKCAPHAELRPQCRAVRCASTSLSCGIRQQCR